MNDLMTPAEAARVKNVAVTTIYAAIADGRLKASRVLGRVALSEEDVRRYEPVRRAGVRPHGPRGRGGRPSGVPMSQESRARISEAQRRRWALRKRDATKQA